MPAPSGWTTARTETLVKLWEAGVSGDEIAWRMGDVSRSAVLGKVFRLGLTKRRSRHVAPSLRPRVRSSRFVWTKERIETLTELWKDGLSGVEIAERFGNVDRSAVISKASRLGLTKRGSPRNTHAPLSARRKTSWPPLERDESPGLRTLLTLGRQECHWPIGDPLQPGFTFCGQGCGDGPYCKRHTRIACA